MVLLTVMALRQNNAGEAETLRMDETSMINSRGAVPMGSRSWQSGFTIFESMVALILVGIMISGAFFVYRHFVSSLDQEFSFLEMQRQGTYVLGLIEERIKQGNHYEIGNYGEGIDNRLTVTVPVVSTATGPVISQVIEYYQDGRTIVERTDRAVVIVPDTHFEGIGVKELMFTTIAADEAGNGISVAINLVLSSSQRGGNEELCQLVGGARMRNAGR
jgi:prepilin-type N-terminal cleavage/methylation domain-containing protein